MGGGKRLFAGSFGIVPSAGPLAYVQEYDVARLARPAILRIWRMGRRALGYVFGRPGVSWAKVSELRFCAHGPST